MDRDRAAAVELVRADRDDDQDPLIPQVTDQEGQEVQRRGVRPLDVLDDQRRRRGAGEPTHDTEKDLEQADLRVASVFGCRLADAWAALAGVGGRFRPSPQLRHQAPELGAVGTQHGRDRSRLEIAEHLAERTDERAVGQVAGPERKAAPRQDPAAGGQDPIGQGLDERGLADPGFASHDHGPGIAGGRPVPGRDEPFQLPGPCDESLAASLVHVPG